MGKFRRGRVRAPAAPLSFERLEAAARAGGELRHQRVSGRQRRLAARQLRRRVGLGRDPQRRRRRGQSARLLSDRRRRPRRTSGSSPASSVPAGGYVLVFASGQDDVAPGQPLHTNFSLAKEGEYLGLIAPDGQTVVDDFGPQFPPQRSDISHGLGQIVDAVHYVAPGAAAQTLVPTSAGYDADVEGAGLRARRQLDRAARRASASARRSAASWCARTRRTSRRAARSARRSTRSTRCWS